MALYDKASLVLIPSGTKEGVCFSQKPTNGDGDFTFTRASSATRVNSDGLIEKETQNLLLQSNQFDTTWVRFNTSVTSGQSGYDGSSDAWLLSKSAANAYINQNFSSGNLNTFSIYAKAGSLNWIAIQISGSPSPYAYFNLSGSGAVGTEVDIIDSVIESVGGGWFRISIAGNNTGFNGVNIYPADADNVLSGTSGNVYIQDAQLESGLVARDYLETTTTAVYGGITDNIPRLDYTDASCPSLLLEPQRTNILYHSEYFGAWSAFGGAVLTHNDAISPEGISNAVKISTNGVFKQDPTAANTDYVFSVFAKTNTATSVTINYVDQTSPFRGGTIIYTFATDAVAVTGQSENNSVTAEREDYGNGWIRVIMNFKTNVAKNYNYQEIRFIGGDGWIYGAQYEAGSYATSYIPTYGASVTRVGETCNSAGNASTFNDSEGVLYFEGSALADDGTNRWVAALSDGTNNERVQIIYLSDNSIAASVISSNSSQCSFNYSDSPATDFNKIAILYKQNDFKMYVNGTQVGSDTSGNAPNGLDTLGFERPTGVSQFYGNAKQILYFPTALTDEELADLTTI
jgi:hypothetical protein